MNGSPSRLLTLLLGGLRLGDPLSPFFFTLVVGAWRSMLLSSKEGGLIRGFEVGKGEDAITHLQFANDTILFNLL